jgi:MFS family permease
MGRLILVFNSSWRASASTSLPVMGILGFLLMCAAVAAGVWISVRISLGQAARENPSFSWWVINRLAFLVGSTNIASFTIFYLQGKLGLLRETAAGPASQLLMFVGIFILVLGFPGAGCPIASVANRWYQWSDCRVGNPGSGDSAWPAGHLSGCHFHGAGIGLFYTASWALGTDIVPKEEAGRYLGIANLAGAGAGAVGAYLGGPIADFFTVNYPLSPGLGYNLLYAVYGLLFVFSVLVLRKIRPPLQPVQVPL